jgi:hypothetical protein
VQELARRIDKHINALHGQPSFSAISIEDSL